MNKHRKHELKILIHNPTQYRPFIDYKTISYFFAEDPRCRSRIGDGRGNSPIELTDQDERQCINVCIEHKKKDDSINGVTVGYSSDVLLKCYCNKVMTSVVSTDVKWRTCFLETSGKYMYEA